MIKGSLPKASRQWAGAGGGGWGESPEKRGREWRTGGTSGALVTKILRSDGW